MDTVEYSPGRSADVYGDAAQPTVLMWHGAQTDSRAAMRPLAERVHGHGLAVVLADWDSHADDAGRADLVASARFAHQRAGGASLTVVGWSMGGTCAVDLAVMHPDLFSYFDDIAGDLSPNSGTKSQTIDRLFGGNAAAYAAFDPTTVMTRHGRYTGVTGRFDINSEAPPEQSAAANSLCALGTANGVSCSVVVAPGKHDWPYAAHAFATALPAMAAQLGTPNARTAGVQPVR